MPANMGMEAVLHRAISCGQAGAVRGDPIHGDPNPHGMITALVKVILAVKIITTAKTRVLANIGARIGTITKTAVAAVAAVTMVRKPGIKRIGPKARIGIKRIGTNLFLPLAPPKDPQNALLNVPLLAPPRDQQNVQQSVQLLAQPRDPPSAQQSVQLLDPLETQQTVPQSALQSVQPSVQLVDQRETPLTGPPRGPQ